MTKTLFSKIFSCFKFLSAILFPFATFMAALYSMYIEAEVITFFVNGALIAWFLVLGLEGGKLSLAYYLHRSSNVPALSNCLRGAKFMRYALTALSLICSLCFFIHIFWGNVDATNQEKVKTSLVELEETYYGPTGKIPTLKEEYQERKEELNQEYNTDAEEERIKTAQESRSKQVVTSDSYTSRIDAVGVIVEQYSKEIAENQKSIGEKNAAKKTAFSRLNEEYYGEPDGKLAKATAEYEKLHSEIKDLTLAESNEVNNPFIHSILTAICRACGVETYSKATYFIVTAIFSLFISVLLEAIIWYGEGLLSLDSKDAELVLGDIELIPTNVIISCLIGIAICGIVLVLGEKSRPTPQTILLIGIAYLAAFSISAHIALPNLPSSNSWLSRSVNFLMPNMFNSILSFGILIILGCCFKDKLSFDDFPSFAVAIGGFLGTRFRNS